MSSPLSRTLEMLRKSGWLADKTEMPYNKFSKVRKDFLGFADALAVKGDEVRAIQATSASNMSARITKITESANAKRWLESSFRTIYVIGWSKKGPRGKRKVWTPTERRIFWGDCLPNTTPKEQVILP